MRIAVVVGGLTAVLLIGSVPADSGDWARFRGPNGSGVSTDPQAVPTVWGPTKNLKWQVALPGPGSSSPIVVGDKVFVTCWSGYGTDRGNPGNQQDLKRHLLCIDRNTGKTIWSKTVAPYLPEDNYGGQFAQHGYASHTPVSDGERVYVYFGKTGAMAFDLDGNELWQKPIGTESDPRGWGSASSPILYKDLLIITAAAESEALVALNKMTGEQVWRQEAQGFSGTWGTPVLVKVDDERTDLVLGVPYEIWAFNPETGKLRWYCEAMDTNSYCSSLISDGEVIYGLESMGGGSIAVRGGGEKDVTKTHVLWSGRQRNRISTPVLADGKIYFFSGSVANCIDAKTGNEIYQARLLRGGNAQPESRGGRGGFGGGPFGGGRGGFGGQDYASPVIADGKIYFQSRSGPVFVIKVGDKFESLAVNTVTEEQEDFSATPAISNGELFLRSSKHLYCVAEK